MVAPAYGGPTIMGVETCLGAEVSRDERFRGLAVVR
jgi:hypothetical protein